MSSQSEAKKLFPQPATGYTKPFWRTSLHPLDSHQGTPDLPSETDILIIGGGYAGASAAYHLFPENQTSNLPRVVLLEARELCSGATGRNGMLCKGKCALIPCSNSKPSRGSSQAGSLLNYIEICRAIRTRSRSGCCPIRNFAYERDSRRSR